MRAAYSMTVDRNANDPCCQLQTYLTRPLCHNYCNRVAVQKVWGY